MTEKQKGVLRGMLVGLLITVLVLAVGLWASPDRLMGIPSGAGLGHLRWVMLLVACQFVAIARLARHRFFTPDDIDGSGLTRGSDTALLLQAFLQNTLEQVTLALPIYTLWVLTLPSSWQAVVPLNSVLFVLGRWLFAMGYTRGAPARALGFALTFYPTVAMGILMIGYWLT